MATARLLSDEDLSPEAAAVFAEIRALRGTDYVNNVWRAMAHDPQSLRAMWDRMKAVMAQGRDGGLDPLTKELVYLAVSIANSCEYCVHSHTAAARAKGLTDTQYGEFLEVVAMAQYGNATATALQVPVDTVYKAEE